MTQQNADVGWDRNQHDAVTAHSWTAFVRAHDGHSLSRMVRAPPPPPPPLASPPACFSLTFCRRESACACACECECEGEGDGRAV
eukprot:3744310-Rhodomonas_salina.1